MTTDNVALLASVIVGAVLPFAQEYLNKLFEIDGKRALVIGAALSALIAILASFLTGGIKGEDLTLQNFTSVFATVFATSQVVFQSVKDYMGWTKKE